MSEQQQKATPQYEEEGISLAELFGILKSRIWWCILGFIVVVAIGVAYLYTTVSQYQSTASILVTPIQSSSNLDSLFSSDITSNSNKRIATEAELLSSNQNIENALSMLDLEAYHTVESNIPFHEDQSLPYSDKAVLGGPHAIASLKKRLTVTTVENTNIVRISLTDTSPQFAHDFLNALATSYNSILTGIARNSKSAQREFIENQIPLNDKELKKATDALGDFRKTSEIVQLSDKTSLLVSETVFFQMKIEPLQMEYKEAMVGLNQYQKDWNSTGLAALPALEEYKKDGKIADALARYSRLQEELTMYEAVSSLNMNGSAGTGGTGTVISLNNKAVTQTTQTVSRTSDLNNSIQQVKKEILDRVVALSGKKGADTYCQTVQKLLTTEMMINVLQAREKVYSDELAKLPELQTKLSDLERDVNVYESVGLKLRDLLEETRLVEASVNSNVTIIDAASLPLQPVSPNKLLILAVSMLLGLAIGVLLALFVNYKDDTIKTVDELTKSCGPDTKFLTWVPFYHKDNTSKYPMLVVQNDPNSFESERLKLIANMIYQGGKRPAVYSVSSCGMSEGKTTIIANVATALSQMGFKVLLIDGDLRTQSQQHFFHIDGKDLKGLSDHVIRNVPLEDLILCPMDSTPNLHFLPAGSKPLVPSAIFTNPGYGRMLDTLKGIYDYIIIDAPPLMYASELLALGKLTDGLAIVARSCITTKTSLHDLVDTLNKTNIHILGIVFNGCGRNAVTTMNGTRYSYGYGYGYSYGYSGEKKRKRVRHHSNRWYVLEYRKILKKRNRKNGEGTVRDKAKLAFPEGFPEGEVHLDRMDPFFKHSPSTHSDMDALAALEKNEDAVGKKGQEKK